MIAATWKPPDEQKSVGHLRGADHLRNNMVKEGVKTLKALLLASSLIGLPALLWGCGGGDSRFDTSSQEAFHASIQKVESELSPIDRDRLGEALELIQIRESLGHDGRGLRYIEEGGNIFAARRAAYHAWPEEQAMLGGRGLPNLIQEFEVIDGLNSDQLFDEIAVFALGFIQIEEGHNQLNIASLGDQLDRDREIFEVSEITSLARSLISANFLGATIQETVFSRRPLISVEINNGSSFAISKICFDVEFRVPQRTVPVYQENCVETDIPGGVEPNETLNIEFIPDLYMRWRDTIERYPELEAVFLINKVTLIQGSNVYDEFALYVRVTQADISLLESSLQYQEEEMNELLLRRQFWESRLSE